MIPHFSTRFLSHSSLFLHSSRARPLLTSTGWTVARNSSNNSQLRFQCTSYKKSDEASDTDVAATKKTPPSSSVSRTLSSNLHDEVPRDVIPAQTESVEDKLAQPYRTENFSSPSSQISQQNSTSTFSSTTFRTPSYKSPYYTHSTPLTTSYQSAAYQPSSTNSRDTASTVPSKSTSSEQQPPSATLPPVQLLSSSSRMWNYSSVYKDMEQTLMKKIHENNQRRFRFLFFCSLSAIVWVVVVFGESFGRKLKSLTTGLALETLEDKSIKIQTEELARAVVQTVLNDKEVTAQAASFLREASHAPETQEALLKLTLHVLQHPDSLKELSLLTRNVLANLSEDPQAIKHLALLFSEVFHDPELKHHLSVVAAEIFKSPEVVAAALEIAELVFRETNVQSAVNDILVEGCSNVMKNEEISVQSRQFVAEVMGDDSLQREGGNALWNSIYHAVVPGAIRISGFTIICLSLGLAGLMLSPY